VKAKLQAMAEHDPGVAVREGDEEARTEEAHTS
jgi:hypothetical protein